MYTDDLRKRLLGEERFVSLNLLKDVTAEDLPSLMNDIVAPCRLGDPFPHLFLVRMCEQIGTLAVQEYLRRTWQVQSEILRTNIAATLSQIPLSDESIAILARHPVNNTRIRHWIASGYYSAVIRQKMKRSVAVLVELLKNIGHYTDAASESDLQEFLRDARSVLETP